MQHANGYLPRNPTVLANALERDALTTGHCANFCKVAPRTVAKWFDSGQLKGYRIPPSGDRRVPVAALVAFLRENGMPVPPELLPGAVLSFGLAQGESVAGCEAHPSAFTFGAAVVSQPVTAALIGDAEGMKTARQAAQAVLASYPRARLVLLAGEDITPTPHDREIFAAIFHRPAKWDAIRAALFGGKS